MRTGRGAKRRSGSGEWREEGGATPALGAGMPAPNGGRKRYTVEAKQEILQDFATSGQSLREFCRANGINSHSLTRWRREHAAGGAAALQPKPNRRNTGGRTGRVVPADERRALLEAFEKLKLPQAVFAKSYGVSVSSLSNWRKAYQEHGPKGLEPKARGRKRGRSGTPHLPQPVRTEIVKTKRCHRARHPGPC